MKKVLLLAAAVLTLGTATAHLGLNGTFGKPVSKAIHKVFEAVKLNTEDTREVKLDKTEYAFSVLEAKSLKPARQAIKSSDAVAMPKLNSAEMTVVASKADIVKKLASKAKAPANISEKYKAKSGVYNDEQKDYFWSDIYTMETASFGEGFDYMIDIIPDQISGMGVPVLYTSVDNGDGTTAITIAPQWEMRNEQHDVFICDFTSLQNGGDGSIKMTLAADGNLTLDNPTNIIGYWATPIDETIEDPIMQEPTLDPSKILGYYERCIQTTFSLPEPDTFVAEATYTGKGYDPTAKQNVTWEMQLGKKDGVNVARNIIPSVESYTGDLTDVKYTIAGDKIVIEPQCVGMFAGYYIYVFNKGAADGVITLTKNSEGHIIAPENLIIWTAPCSDDSFSTLVNMYLTKTEKVQYYAEGQEIPAPAPLAMYEPASTILNVGLGLNGYTFATSWSMLPAYAEIPYINTTTDEATSWSWEVCDSVANETGTAYVAGENKVTSTDRDFSFMTQGGAVFGAPTLIGVNGTSVSVPYIWGAKSNGLVYQYVGETITSFENLNATVGAPQASVCNPAFGFASYTDLSTPDICDANNVDEYVTAFYMYQGKPAAPLYITGLNLMVNNLTVQPGFTLTARIVEAKRNASGSSFTIGNTIALADATVESIEKGTATISSINFNDLYVLDEDGMSQSLDHLFLDQEFAVVIEGLNSGDFSCMFMGESNERNTRTSTNTLFDVVDKQGNSSRYRMPICMTLGFNEATYGYLHTANNTNFTVLATGGEEKIHIDAAMYSNVGDNEVKSPRFFVSDNCPEWVTVDVENANEEGRVFDLKFTFAENEGVARKATFYVWQEGAKIDVTVDQAGTINTGISGITAEGAANGPRYNVAGQRVDASAKGIVISNGKKQIAK